jgi:hypothetical protein
MKLVKGAIAGAMAAVMVAGGGYAAASGKAGFSAQADYGIGAPMSWPERKALITAVVHKWSGYVQKVHGIKPQVWARSMGATFAAADPVNFRRAASMTTYEGMIATLLGQRTTDAKIIDTLARSSKASTLAALASPATGLVFTMVQPCRIIDTRVAGGKIDANTLRDFEASRPGGSFASQGGSNDDCGMPADPAAVVMNVTVVDAEGSGFLAVWPYNTPMPLASSNNYSIGRNTGNEIIARQTIGDAFDFSVYPNRRVHVVVDVTGYFSAPVSTALVTSIANSVNVAVANGKQFTATANCPPGYSVTGGGNVASPNTSGLSLSESSPTAGGTGWRVSGKNTSGGPVVLHASAVCAIDN